MLIADRKMSELAGLTLIRQVKRIHLDLPIIITNSLSESSAIEAINLGVVSYLTKPFRVPQMLVSTARALGDPAG